MRHTLTWRQAHRVQRTDVLPSRPIRLCIITDKAVCLDHDAISFLISTFVRGATKNILTEIAPTLFYNTTNIEYMWVCTQWWVSKWQQYRSLGGSLSSVPYALLRSNGRLRELLVDILSPLHTTWCWLMWRQSDVIIIIIITIIIIILIFNSSMCQSLDGEHHHIYSKWISWWRATASEAVSAMQW